MSIYGWWILGCVAVYTMVLIAAGSLAQRRASGSAAYFVADRRFSSWQVALAVTGLFSGSTFIAVLELSYLRGVSAMWYGVAESVQVLLIAWFLIRAFRQRQLVTISGLIGDHYGRQARAVAGLITAFAFPMWSVATALAFASGLYAFTGLPLNVSVAVTALLLLVYLQAGGMWSVAFTQTINVVAFAAMFAVGLYAFFREPGWNGLVAFLQRQPSFLDPLGVGTQVIIAWFGTFIVNVILAQAAFQMALSCRTPAEGRRGMLLALGLGLPFIVLGALFGISAAAVVPGLGRGLVAVPLYVAHVLPPPLVGVFFIGIWASALGWAAPCQFSGATSLGRDVGQALRPEASEADLVRYTRLSLVVLTVLMVVFGVLRSEQSAWWNILAWTSRNSATFAPVLAALLWPLVSRRAAVASMIVGTIGGLGWYQLSGWAINRFFLDIHPVWVGMGLNLVTLEAISLLDLPRNGWSWAVAGSRRHLWGLTAVGIGILGEALTIAAIAPLRSTGLLGLALFAGLTALSAGTFLLIRPGRTERAPAVASVLASDPSS